jgi:hypothetical protein
MDSDNKNFKLADSVLPLLTEGKYTVKGVQDITVPQKESFSSESCFYVAADTEKLSEDKIFGFYPNASDKGDYSGTLPFIVFNDPVYPWLSKQAEDIDSFAVPWLALIVVCENEVDSETDVKHSELASLKENGVYFPYDSNCVTTSADDDNVHLLTLSKDIFNRIVPSKEDMIWLTHAKYVNLSASEDSIAEQDGWFSTVIANRFVPSEAGKEVRSTAHLVSMKGYSGDDIPSDCSKIRMISLYHMDICSAAVSERCRPFQTEHFGK